MRSHDYNQFEVCLPLPEAVASHVGRVDTALISETVDECRKTAAKLVDKAVAQYDRMKRTMEMVTRLTGREDQLREEVRAMQHIPEKDWSPEHKAKAKLLGNFDHHKLRQAEGYQYDDDDDHDFDDDPTF